MGLEFYEFFIVLQILTISNTKILRRVLELSDQKHN